MRNKSLNNSLYCSQKIHWLLKYNCLKIDIFVVNIKDLFQRCKNVLTLKRYLAFLPNIGR